MPLTITHAKSQTFADFTGTVTVNNSSGGTATVMATDLVRPVDWNSGHATTLSLTGSEIASLFNFGSGLASSTNASGVSAWVKTQGFFEPVFTANTNSTLSAPGVGTWYLHPFNLAHGIGSGQINLLAADAAGFLNGTTFTTASTASISRYQTLNTQLAIYQMGTGASTTRLESIWSTEVSSLFTWIRAVTSSTTGGGGSSTIVRATNQLNASFLSQYDASGGATYGSTSTSASTSTNISSMASTGINNLITAVVAYVSGSKMVPVPFATSLAAGAYYLAAMISSTSSSTGTNYSFGTMASTQSAMHVLEFVNQAYKRQGISASDSSSGNLPFHGSYATTSATPPSVIATSDMRNFATNHRLAWNYVQSSY